ncbi:hypothetical protein KGP36_06000 [Patescibacteria group bacterium]|nr:hypothetical protein [Patescibacteria group bacterium]
MYPEIFHDTPIISMYPPWANWVALGWKTIETRTHNRFKSLAGRYIGIHAPLKWDNRALELAAPFLTYEQFGLSKDFLRVGGAIICKAFVRSAGKVGSMNSLSALIDCQSTTRYGLFLEDIEPLKEAIPCKGKQGIWYYRGPESMDRMH